MTTLNKVQNHTTQHNTTPPMMKQLLVGILAAGCMSCAPPPAVSNPLDKSPHLILEQTGENNKFGNPILRVLMVKNGTVIDSVRAVSGRSWTQQRPRDVSGTQAPLPNGKYEVNPTVFYVNTNPELGSKFVEIFPLFSTGRTHLGFHVDPSFNRDPKEDGTEGCIGLVDSQQRDTLFHFITRTQAQTLIVRIK